jgi:glycosyltransferase involved in cell wall biosynthesis
MDRSRVAIVIPAYDESDTIARVVVDVSPHGIPIVVDDASRDDTGEVAMRAGATVVRNPVNLGYDGALNAGFTRAVQLGVDFLVTFDGDGQHDPSGIADVLELLEGGADMVVGIRPRKARVTEWAFAGLTRLRYGIRDPLCGLKGYRVELYNRLGHFDSRGSIGTELMLYGLRAGCRVRQIPIELRERHGASRFGDSVRGNLKILRAMVGWLTA